MSSNSTDCSADDQLCIVTEHQLAVIIVPTLLLLFTAVTLLIIFLLLYGPSRKRYRSAAHRHTHTDTHRHTHTDAHRHTHTDAHRHTHTDAHRHTHTDAHTDAHRHTHRHTHRNQQRLNNSHPLHNHHRRHLTGIDAPAGIDPLEHEELPMSVQQQQNVRPSLAAAAAAAPTERPRGAFSHVSTLNQFYSVSNDPDVSLFRARMDGRSVVLRVLRESCGGGEQRVFLGFASFLSALGSHAALPALLGVVTAQPPLITVMEELQHRDLLGLLWRSRLGDSGAESSSVVLTERRILSMAGNVASALSYLHGRGCVHGNVGARSVLVGGDLTAKLWGLGPAYRRKTGAGPPRGGGDSELTKWQAPEVQAGRSVSESSDIWSFGVLLYEMVTLGDPPFAQIEATALLQHLQRGNHLEQPATCSDHLFSVLRSCCRWKPENRTNMAALISGLQAGERAANGRTALRVNQPINFQQYLREAGYGPVDYAVL